MDFGNLPEVVIACLFSYMPEETLMPEEKLLPNKRFSSDLSFLAVSRQWRTAALPMAYRTLFVEANLGRDRSMFDEHGLDLDFKLVSNFDLAARGGYLRYTRKIGMALRFDYNPLKCVQAMLNLLKLYQQDWPDVSIVELWYVQNLFRYSEDNEDNLALDGHGSEVDAIIQQFAQLMPTLKSISIETRTKVPIMCEFNKQLLQAYGGSLNKLYVQDEILLLNPGAFTQLAYVDIDIGNSRMKALPFICAETLIKLHLRSCPVDFVWVNTLDSDSVGSSQIVEFPRLQHLTLDFIDVWADNAGYSYPMLIFPKLQYLFVESGNIDLFLDYAIFPATMHTVKIRASANDMKKLTQVNLPKIEMFDIEALFFEENDIKCIIECADCIVAQQHPLSLVNLMLIGLFAPLDTDGNLLQSITGLAIIEAIAVHEFINMVKSPKLKNIVIHDLDFTNIPSSAMFMDQSPTNGEKVVPYISQLESLFIQLDHEYPANVILPVVYDLLLKLPTLRKFKTDRGYIERIKEFIVKYKCQYPHLGNIKVVQG